MQPKNTSGFAVITVLLMVVVLMSLIVAHFFLTNVEVRTTAAQAASASGFYAAESGLNLRGDDILNIFREDNLPVGVSPSATDPCTSGNQGSGDFACEQFTLNDRDVMTYVVEDPLNTADGALILIPQNELFGGLNALESRYSVFSRATHPTSERVEAILEMIFRSRVVPIFQFAAFYNKDLEINPGPDMTLNGRVHANGNLYLTSDGNTLSIDGQVTVAKRPGSEEATGLHRHRKDDNRCTGQVQVDDLSGYEDITCGMGSPVPQTTLDQWNGQIVTGLDTLTVPPLRSFEPGGEYWDRAELRVALVISGSSRSVVVRNADGSQNSTLTTRLRNCQMAPGSNPAYRRPSNVNERNRAVHYSNSFRNNREGASIEMLEVDVAGVLNCLHANRNDFLPGNGINDTSQGGLVFFFTVEGNNSNGQNNYGIRLRNGDQLAATIGGAPAIQGLTVVSDQAVYVQGDYNLNSSWKPASIIADSLNILSEAFDLHGSWTGSDYADQRSHQGLGSRDAERTEVNAAFLAGTDVTGGSEGSAGENRGNYNGGLENYPRFHEDWSGVKFRYRGSFVSFNEPQHVDGHWGTGNVYDPPTRDWEYDTRFNNINELPPMSPTFVYLRQELFVREFEQ